MATTVLVLVRAIKPVGLVSLQNSWSRAVSKQEIDAFIGELYMPPNIVATASIDRLRRTISR